MNYGIIDIGSNTIRLVIYKTGAKGFCCLFNEKHFVQLIGYVKNGVMRDEGVRSMISALKQLTEMAANYKPIKLLCFATAPFRAVSDTQPLLDVIRNFTGLDVKILSAEEEARLGFFGASYLHGARQGLYVDLGGGSVELSLFKDGKISYSQSLDFGCVSLNAAFVDDILPTKAELKHIKEYVDKQLETLGWLEQAQGLEMYLIGGTARALGQLHRVMYSSAVPLDAYSIVPKDIKTVCTTLMESGTEGIRLMTKHCPGRIFTLLPGAYALWRVAKKSGVSSVHFSTFGVREGYMLENIFPSLLPNAENGIE